MLNCRGRLMPVVDLGARLHLRAPAPIDPSAHLLVVRLRDRMLAGLVDQVLEVVSVPDDAFVDRERVAPSELPLDLGLLAGAIRRDDGAVALLDLERVLSAQDTAAIDRAQEARP
jgi:chemotaxis signal transduction protein